MSERDDDITGVEGGLERDPEDDPRGGYQSEEYRRADPRDLVVEGGTAMSGPGGAPQEREPVARDAEPEPHEPES